MEDVIYYLLLLVVVILVPGGLIFLGYWIPKKLGHKKLGTWIASIITLAILFFMFQGYIDEFFFFKSDAVKELAKYNIKLEDDFQISSNTVENFPKYYWTFELSITENDKKRLQDQITNASDFQGDWEDFDIEKDRHRYSNEDITYTAHYAANNSYIFESFHPNKQGYIPTHIRISISQKVNTLTYEELWY